MNKTRIFFLLALASVASAAWAAPVTPDEALVRMKDFAASQTSMRMKAPVAAESRLVYTAKAEGTEDAAFYVFNNPSGGFMILSADDRLPEVLGFSNNGAFDLDRISPDMKWWLGEYSKDIARMYKSEGVGTPVQASAHKRATVTERTPIEPMLKTRWNQMAPYNMLTPRQYPTGCVATAMAQVMKYHEWPIEPVGTQGGLTFDGTVYDWENMIDDYESNSYSTVEAEAVATLMRQCGASVNMMYTAYASGAYSHDVPVALYTYFGYNESMELLYRDYYKMSEWNDIVYAELAGNRPVYYSGSSSNGGHAFVCDGYLGNNYFHFNWGWGGYQDGYFLLNALNPGVGGTGSFAGGYNNRQSIITGVKKSEGETKRQVSILSTGSFMYDRSSGRFAVDSDPDGYNMFYNPLGYVVSGTFGVKVTPMGGGESKYFQSAGGFSFDTGYGATDYACNISGLSEGTYKVEPAFINGGEWYPVGVVVGTQPYVTLTVADGKYTYANNGLPDEDKPHLLSGLPRTLPTVYGDGAKIFRVTVVNTQGGDYNNDLTLSMYEQGKGGAGVVRETTNHVTVPGNSSLDVDFVIGQSNPEGVYEIYLMDYLGNYLVSPANASDGRLVADYVLETKNSGRDIWNDAQMIFSDISPNFWTLGDGGIGMVMSAKNVFYAEATQTFNVKLLRASDFKEVFSFGPYNLTLSSNAETIVNFTSSDIELEPGEYFWQIMDSKNRNLSRLYPLMVSSEVKEKDGLYYQVTSQVPKRARIVAPTTGEYKGVVNIPSDIDGYEVNDIRVDAFTFADEVKEIRLPWTVRSVENGSFYNASNLEVFGAYDPNLATLYPDAFAPGARENIKFDTYMGKANMYAYAPLWEDFIFSGWEITLGDGVVLDKTKMEFDPMTGEVYNPYYTTYNENMILWVVNDDEKMSYDAVMTIDGVESTARFHEGIWLPVIGATTAQVTIVPLPGAGVSDVSGEDRVTVIGIDGVTVLRNAPSTEINKLPRGLYIINGRKVVL